MNNKCSPVVLLVSALWCCPLFAVEAATDPNTPSGAVQDHQGEKMVSTPEHELARRAQAPLLEGMGDYHRTISTSDPIISTIRLAR